MGQFQTAVDSGKPFRLDLERLLSDGSNMGDVLARLIDAAMDAQMNGAVHGVEAEVTRVAESATRKRLIAEKGRSAALAEIRALVLSQVRGPSNMLDSTASSETFEEALLAHVLADNALLDSVHGLQPADFADPVHRELFETMRDLRREGCAVNMATLSGLMGSDPLGGARPVQTRLQSGSRHPDRAQGGWHPLAKRGGVRPALPLAGVS